MEDLNGLRVFLRVADSLSFTAAATRLGLTPSAVSKSISRLEKEYGQRLLDRTTRRVGLTNDGHAFYERCRQVLADLEEAENQLTHQSIASPRGHLRVHMPTAFGKKVVLPRLFPILESLTDLRIDVELGERPLDLAEEGLDAVVRFGAPNSGVIARRLCGVRFVACASPKYLARHGEPRTPDDLERHACLGYATPWRAHYREWTFAGPDGAPTQRGVSGKLNVNSAEALTEAAIAGSGIAMVADFVAWEAVRAGRLRVLLKEFIGPAMPVFLVYLPGRQHSPRIRWFLQTLQEMIPSPAPWEVITRAYNAHSTTLT